MSDGTVQLQALRDKLVDGRALFFAVNETKVLVAERAFDNGKLTSGADVEYQEDYEVYAYTPPSPRKVTGKGKPYVDWLVRPESISEKKAALKKSIARNADIYRRTKSVSAEIRGENASQKLEAFKKRFGADARKIKGGYYKTYLEYKRQQGRGPLELTGRLQKNYLSAATTVEVSALEVNIVLRGEEAEKYRGLTDSKGPFLQFSQAEREFFLQRLKAQI